MKTQNECWPLTIQRDYIIHLTTQSSWLQLNTEDEPVAAVNHQMASWLKSETNKSKLGIYFHIGFHCTALSTLEIMSVCLLVWKNLNLFCFFTCELKFLNVKRNHMKFDSTHVKSSFYNFLTMGLFYTWLFLDVNENVRMWNVHFCM